MKTNRLEEFIKANRADFDQLEPSPEVWKRISGANRKQKIFRMNRFLIKAAAVVAIVVATSALLINTDILKHGNFAGEIDDPELRELIEAESFYAHQVNGKLIEIRKCYFTFPELKEEIESDLSELQQMYDTLKGDLKENISNKAVIEAMIENNRYRLKLVDDVLEQIKC